MALAELRPTLRSYLTQRLTAFHEGFRHNLALLGPVGSGKTMLLQQVLESAGDRMTVVQCSLQHDSMRDFLRRFTHAVLHAIAPDAPFDAPTDQLLAIAEATAPKTAAAIHQLQRYASGHLPADGFVHALDLIPLLHAERQRPCVLVLDEFLHLERLGLSHAFHELGKRVMTWPFTLFLLSSSSGHQARHIVRERLQLLFGQFELVPMGPIESAAAAQWIQRELPNTKHHPTLIQFLLHWVGTHPWYVSVLLNRMKELALMKRERKLADATFVQAAWDVLGNPNGVLYQWCQAQTEQAIRLANGPLAREALLAIAQGARTSQTIAQSTGGRRSVPGVLQQLVEHDLVQRKGACWVIPDQLLAFWLRTVLAPRQSQKAPHATAAFQIFDRALRDLWNQWLIASQQPLAQRVAGLLGTFRNETVSLDHKTGRLPYFDRLSTHQPVERVERYILAEDQERRWCCLVHEGTLDESGVAAFEQFCRVQQPRPARKIVVARRGLELNAKLLAKEANMWVWEPQDVNLLFLLYGHPPLDHA